MAPLATPRRTPKKKYSRGASSSSEMSCPFGFRKQFRNLMPPRPKSRNPSVPKSHAPSEAEI